MTHRRPGSRRADLDLELLARPDLRPVRLLLEYLKPELALRDHRVRSSVVVFGSTRLAPGSPYYEIGRELGRIVGRYGLEAGRGELVVVTGGGPGGMEAANRGALEVGALSVGLNIALPGEQEPNPYLTPELSFEFRYFALRKLHFMLRARALLALPGGYGTLDELFETLCLVQTRKRDPLPVVLIGEEFWSRAVDFGFLAERGVIDREDLDLFGFAESAGEAWDAVLDWYESRGLSVLGDPDPPAGGAG